MDPGSKDRLLRNITIAVTAVSAALLLTADYGPNPHALSSISDSVKSVKDWFWTPSPSEQAALQQRLETARNKDSSASDVPLTVSAVSGSSRVSYGEEDFFQYHFSYHTWDHRGDNIVWVAWEG